MNELFTFFLDNGIEVIFHKIPKAKVVGIGMWIKQGSRNEHIDNNGISHVAEHMVFNRNNIHNTQLKNCFNEINENGIMCNASTTKECTRFYFETMSYNIRICLDTMLAMIKNFKFENTVFEKEKKVIERELSSFFSSFNQIAERTGQALYGNFDIGKLILGSIQNLNNFTIDEVEQLVWDTYTPENTIIIVVGDIDYSELKHLIYEKFQSLEDRSTKVYSELPDNETGVYYDNNSVTNNNTASIGFRIPIYANNEVLYTELLSIILADPILSNRLYKELREVRSLVYIMGGFVAKYKDCCTLGLTSVFEKSKSKEVFKVVIEELNKITFSGVSDEELTMAKRKLITTKNLNMTSLESKLFHLGNMAIHGKVEPLEREIRNKIFNNIMHTELVDLKTIPLIDENILDRYLKDDIYYYPVDVGRGCPFSCSYCCTSYYWKRKYRLKSPDDIVAEIKYIKNKYGIKRYSFNHDLFTLNKKLVRSVCEKMIKQKLDIEWGCSARVDTLSKEIIDIMYEAGCRNIYLGIETGSAKMQRIINKNIKIDDILLKTSYLAMKGYRVTCSFIYGFLDESIEDLEDSMRLVSKMLELGITNIQMHPLMVLPKTEEMRKTKNLLYFDEKNINAFPAEERYLSEMVELIRKHKALFSNFYTYDTEIRLNFKHLDIFVANLLFMNKYFKYIYKKYSEAYNNDYLRMYKNNEDLIIHSIETLRESKKDIDLYKELRDNNVKMIEIIKNRLKKKINDQHLDVMFELGKSLYFFALEKKEIQRIKFPVNVIKLQKMSLNQEEIEEPIEIELRMNKNAIIDVRRVL